MKINDITRKATWRWHNDEEYVITATQEASGLRQKVTATQALTAVTSPGIA